MSDAMDSDVREVIRRRIALRERDGHERLLLNHVDLRALLDAADEADRLQDIERRLAVLLCNLTGGKLSKTDYPVEFMEQEIEECLAECHESDLRDERNWLQTVVGRLGRVNGEYAMEIRRCREALGVDEDTDPHHAAQALAAAVKRVRALHTRGTVEMVTATDCLNEDCDHDGDCPTQPVDVCLGCVEFAETATLYALEHADVQERVAWPCAHIRALDGTDDGPTP